MDDDKIVTITISLNRRWFQFSLVTMLLLTVIAGMWLGIAGQAFRQRSVWQRQPLSDAASDKAASSLRDLNWVDEAQVKSHVRQGTVVGLVGIRSGQPLKSQHIDVVRNRVAQAIPGLTEENLAVVDVRTGVSYPP